jgi:hypothetical protein
MIFEINYNYSARLNPFHYDDYVVIDLNLTDIQRNNMLVYMDQLKGDYYDVKKLVWLFFYRTFGIDLPWVDDKSRYVCSEMTETLLAMVGKIPSSEVGRHTPNTLYEYLKNLKE